MRLWKVAIVTALAFGVGLLAGYLWWERDMDRLRRELTSARQERSPAAGGATSWSVSGIVRAVRSADSVLITHEPIPGLMGAMTMEFRVAAGAQVKGMQAGDRVRFTLNQAGNDLVVVDLRKETDR